METTAFTSKLHDVLLSLDSAVIACSGGIDSLLLSTIACRMGTGNVLVAHAISPAVPQTATARVRKFAAQEGWQLHILTSGEFIDPKYLENPANRCYYCKSHLYFSLRGITIEMDAGPSACLLSGANIDDLREYRPGLEAAKEFGVRHPFIEAGMGKREIRILARELGLPFSELPASPCLASRLYTGTEVTQERLRAVEAGEDLIRSRWGIGIVRCRLRENDMLIEVPLEDQAKIDSTLLDQIFASTTEILPQIESVRLDPRPYKSGRAFLVEAAN
jgi:uncharacterized protein